MAHMIGMLIAAFVIASLVMWATYGFEWGEF